MAALSAAAAGNRDSSSGRELQGFLRSFGVRVRVRILFSDCCVGLGPKVRFPFPIFHRFKNGDN